MNWLIYDEGETIIKENIFNEYEVVYDEFAKDKVTISKKITDALKSNNLNDTFELLINEYVTLQKKHNITQRALTGLTLDFNKLKERVNILADKG
jgi:methyl coenzyme M reductase subunit D